MLISSLNPSFRVGRWCYCFCCCCFSLYFASAAFIAVDTLKCADRSNANGKKEKNALISSSTTFSQHIFYVNWFLIEKYLLHNWIAYTNQNKREFFFVWRTISSSFSIWITNSIKRNRVFFCFVSCTVFTYESFKWIKTRSFIALFEFSPVGVFFLLLNVFKEIAIILLAVHKNKTQKALVSCKQRILKSPLCSGFFLLIQLRIL